jgi:hypothetical protein
MSVGILLKFLKGSPQCSGEHRGLDCQELFFDFIDIPIDQILFKILSIAGEGNAHFLRDFVRLVEVFSIDEDIDGHGDSEVFHGSGESLV